MMVAVVVAYLVVQSRLRQDGEPSMCTVQRGAARRRCGATRALDAAVAAQKTLGRLSAPTIIQSLI